MTIIDLGTVKIRFDPQDIRVSIDGDKIDVGVREKQVLPEINDIGWANTGIFTIDDPDKDTILRNSFLEPVVKKELDKLEKKIRKKTKYRPE